MIRLLTIPFGLWRWGLGRLAQHLHEVVRSLDVAHVFIWALLLAPATLGLFDLGTLPDWAWVGILGGYYLVVAPLLVAFYVPPTAGEEAAKDSECLLGPHQEVNTLLKGEVAQLRGELAIAQTEGQRSRERLEAENRILRKALDEYRVEVLKRGGAA
jgi:hypothetical protein